MKIPSIKGIVAGVGITIASAAFTLPASAVKTQIQQVQKIQKDTTDTFTRTAPEITPSGISDSLVLKYAPSPIITVQGEKKSAIFVVDLSKNVLYHYDETGKPQMAYLVASGKPSTPTDKGIRVVSHTETYPYKSAPPSTKRYRNPRDYGPKAIILRILDPLTGETTQTGEFIHGNKDASSIGKYISKGCIRMDNEVIKKLAQIVKRGDIILIK